MTDFKFKVGDRVRLANWDNGSWVQVLCVGDHRVLVKDQDGFKGSWQKNHNWQLYEAVEQTEGKKLREALEFYAEGNEWDYGVKARRALEGENHD